MAKFNIEAQTQEVEARISQMQAAGANMTPVWQAVGNNLVNRIRLGFRVGQDPWGVPWHPIKFRAPRVGKRGLTKAGREQLAANASGNAGQPLVDKGVLRRSITARADNAGVVVGTNLIYGPTHQFGATIKPKKGPFLVFGGPGGNLIFARSVTVPARPFMPLNAFGKVSLPPTWAANIIRMLVAHFKLNQAPVSV